MSNNYDNEDDNVPSELEKEFEEAYNKAYPLIDAELKMASEALSRAVDIAKEYGVPFRARVSPLSQGYIPTSLSKKFPKISSRFISEVCDVYDRHGDGLYPGWQHSSIC